MQRWIKMLKDSLNALFFSNSLLDPNLVSVLFAFFFFVFFLNTRFDVVSCRLQRLYTFIFVLKKKLKKNDAAADPRTYTQA